MNCPKCQMPITKEDAVFCGSCGEILRKKKKSGGKLILLLLVPFIVIVVLFIIAFKAMNDSPFVAEEYAESGAYGGERDRQSELEEPEDLYNRDDEIYQEDYQEPEPPSQVLRQELEDDSLDSSDESFELNYPETDISDEPPRDTTIPDEPPTEIHPSDEPSVEVDDEYADEFVPPEEDFDNIYWLMYNYARAVADGVNSKDFSYISGYMLYDSPIYKEQIEYISNVNAYEEFTEFELLSLEYANPNRCVVTVKEGYYIDNFRAEPGNKAFKSTYTLIRTEGVWLIHSLDEFVTLL